MLFSGIIDLIHMQVLTFTNKGVEVQKTNLAENHQQFQEAIEARNLLVESLSEFNDDVAEFIIEMTKIINELLTNSL